MAQLRSSVEGRCANSNVDKDGKLCEKGFVILLYRSDCITRETKINNPYRSFHQN